MVPIQFTFERLYEWRWWISAPLITVSVIAESATRPVAWIAGALIIAHPDSRRVYLEAGYATGDGARPVEPTRSVSPPRIGPHFGAVNLSPDYAADLGL